MSDQPSLAAQVEPLRDQTDVAALRARLEQMVTSQSREVSDLIASEMMLCLSEGVTFDDEQVGYVREALEDAVREVAQRVPKLLTALLAVQSSPQIEEEEAARVDVGQPRASAPIGSTASTNGLASTIGQREPWCPLCLVSLQYVGWVGNEDNTSWSCACGHRIQIKPFIPSEARKTMVPPLSQMDSDRRMVTVAAHGAMAAASPELAERLITAIANVKDEPVCECGALYRDHTYWEDRIYDVNGYRCPPSVTGRDYRFSQAQTLRHLRLRQIAAARFILTEATAAASSPMAAPLEYAMNTTGLTAHEIKAAKAREGLAWLALMLEVEGADVLPCRHCRRAGRLSVHELHTQLRATLSSPPRPDDGNK